MIYFDNASTTKVSHEVSEKVIFMLEKCYGNPSSLHKLGFEAEKEIKEAKKNICDFLKIDINDLFFTSGGTEANNLAIFGSAYANKRKGRNIITMPIEHQSVIMPFKKLEEDGFNVIYLDVDNRGYIDKNKLIENLNDETILVSIMYVNNEIGTIQDIEDIGNIIKKKNKDIIFHVDAVQAFCKHNINIKNIDLLSISGHKIHAPKGIGALYIKKGTKITPILFGGEQQNRIRPGTENSPGIAAFGMACKIAAKNMELNFKKVKNIKSTLMNIVNLIEGVKINGDAENASPYILNMTFEDVKSEVLMHKLEEYEIYVSTGSACSSSQKKHLNAVDILNKEKTEGTVRFSFCDENTVEEAEKCVEILKEIIPFLRRFKQR